jgi:hypothetical protein
MSGMCTLLRPPGSSLTASAEAAHDSGALSSQEHAEREHRSGRGFDKQGPEKFHRGRLHQHATQSQHDQPH